MESIYSYPVSVGCLVYPEFKEDRIVVNKEFEIIDDQLRQWFIEERDEKIRMVSEEIEPEVAQNCYQTCPYYDKCH